jgi:endoglucanase
MIFGGSALGLAIAAMVVASLTCNEPAPTESRNSNGTVETSTPATGSLAGLGLYSEPDSRALATAATWRSGRSADADLIDRLARTPQGTWFNGWQPDPRAAAASLAQQANDRGAVPVIVVYNIPNRDCGEHSAGGAASPSAYQAFVQSIADGIRGKKTIVVLEPDAVAGADCLGGSARDARYAMLRNAVNTLVNAGAWVYIDAGHTGWHSPAEIANRLKNSGLSQAAGFALNVSNFVTTAANVDYGDAVAGLTGGKHYIIDTSRNGLGPAANGEWCNPLGRAVGELPTTTTGHGRLDALLWVKNPGDSDGPCNGGPQAGEWWAEYALGLMKRAP